MKEWWITFSLMNTELCAYTVRGTFPGELAATKELIAGEQGVSPDLIEVKKVYR